MGRLTTWNHAPIKTLRLPQPFAAVVMQIARALDVLEDDQQLVFIYSPQQPEEPSFKVTKSFTPAALQALFAAVDLQDFAAKPLLQGEAEDVDVQELEQAAHDVDLLALVNDSGDSEATAAEADPNRVDIAEVDPAEVFARLIREDEEIDQTFDAESETDELQDLETWEQAIGDVAIVKGTTARESPPYEEDGLLPISEISTLFARTPAETHREVDPDDVYESFLSDAIIEEIDPDDVLASLVESTEPAIPLEPTAIALPSLPIPALEPLNAAAFAAALFDTWHRLATQQQSGAEPWGVPVELNHIYRAQFATLLGSHFLEAVGKAALQPTKGRRIQLIATPGIVNSKVAGVDANALTYESDRPKTTEMPTPMTQTAPTPEGKVAVTPPRLTTTGISESDRLRLLQERQRRLANPTNMEALKVERHPWIKRLLSL